MAMSWELLTFKDMFVDFVLEQRQNVMLGNYSHLVSKGYLVAKPDAIFRLGLGKKSRMIDGGNAMKICPKIYPDKTLLFLIRQRLFKYYSWGRCSKHNLNIHSQNRGYVRKKDERCKVYWNLLLILMPVLVLLLHLILQKLWPECMISA
uniref:KRAB domain-containing protein n=1 Tax=Theropithecus gelada TaxID=9565 RepID=A0A8D2K6A5_THEGE